MSWAKNIRQRGDGWPHLVALVANFVPSEVVYIEEHYSYVRLARLYLDRWAGGEDAFDYS